MPKKNNYFSIFCALASAVIVVYLLQSGWFDSPDYADDKVGNFVDGLVWVVLIVGLGLTAAVSAVVYFKQKRKEDK